MVPVEIVCTKCGLGYPEQGVPYCCPSCGGIYDFRGPLLFDKHQVDSSQPGIWRYCHTFVLPPESGPVSLGEGNTPLIWVEAFGRKVALKCEYLNPSGSFKDRGSSVIAALLKSRGVTEAVEDSSGNAGASFAAYAARAGIRAKIYVPESASGPKRRQIEAYGAELLPIPGLRSDVARAVRQAAEAGAIYASHAYLPFNLPGYATAAYEIFEQLGEMPGSVFVPAGQGGLLFGLVKGFDALRITNNSYVIPKMIGIQAKACAPLWAMFTSGEEGLALVVENPTAAEGVRGSYSLRGDSVLEAVTRSRGAIVAVDEQEILPARESLAHLGFYVEPTSALVWPALSQMIKNLPDPIVVILTGSGLKYG